MKYITKIVCTIIVLGTLVVPTSSLAQVTNSAKSTVSFTNTFFTVPFVDDYDPLVDQIVVTVTIQEIRALDNMDLLSDPDFYIKISINNNTFKSPVWRGMKYVEELWSASCEVPKDTEMVDIVIELWDRNPVGRGQLCDISPESYGLNPRQEYTAELTYSIATGSWSGDDSILWDLSGYGRLNGCDDNSINQNDRDAEVFFTISQNDFDGDGLPYWIETNMYNMSPLIDNRGEDADKDGVPIEWEHRFGLFYFPWHDEDDEDESFYYLIYDPNKPEDHATLDPDKDGLTNWEEYKTWPWGSDPSRKDIFIEIDQMEIGPNGEGAFVPTQAFDLIRDAHAKHNIVWHIDDGRLGGGELIPFKEVLDMENDTSDWYWDYFMHGDTHNWRRGVFRWCIIAYNYTWAKGFTFGSNINGSHAVDCFFLSTKYHELRAKIFPIIDGLHRGTFNREMNRAYVYAGVMMHETGHMLNIQAPGYDVSNTIWIWQVNYWRFANYKSCGNYRYVYRGVVDYSDGSHGKNDFDDWANMDLTYFNPGNGWW